MSEEEVRGHEEERRALRPYRRVVVVIFALAIAALSALVLRGIIRALDRLPSAAALHKPDEVDVRALRACAEDLERLEVRIRRAAGEALSRSPAAEDPPEWETTATGFELERLTLVARCHLDEASEEPAAQELAVAAAAVEGLLRAYGLLHARHRAEGLGHSREAQRALERAREALRARP